MPVFANIFPTIPHDGVTYCANMLIPAAEGELFNGGTEFPVPIIWDRGLSAIVELAIQGAVLSQSCYVVMQTEFGDFNWLDVAWCNYSGLTPTQFNLTAGATTLNSAFQQTRARGTTPTPSNSSNPILLGGRVRFVGNASITTSSSSSSAAASSSLVPALVPGVLATIRYKKQGLR